MDSIPTTPIPASDLPIQQGNNRSMSRRLSTRFPSSKDATYPDDIANEFGQSPLSGSRRGAGLDPGMRTRTLQRNSSVAQRTGSASARYDNTIRIGTEDTDDENEDDDSRDENEEADSTEEGDQEAKGGGEEPVRMSLMALLGESEGSLYMMGEDEDDEDDDAGGDVVGGEGNSCCVCQVRHKGAAFVPCGHSFCRLCSRELWVEGGNCPLCNNFILEILDIF